MIVYTVKWLLPVVSPPVADAAVAMEHGRIAAAGRRSDVLEQAGADAEVRDLGDAVLMPGLVNAHTHLELSWMGAAPPEAGDYMTWLNDFVRKRSRVDEAAARQAAERTVEQALARGTVAVGDVSNEIWTASILARTPLFGIVFHELLGFPTSVAERLLDEAASSLDSIEADADVAQAGERLRVVLTPHAAHSTSAALLKALGGRARAAQAPLSIHVAESEAEVRFLHDGSGPFREFLVERGKWDDSWTPPGHSPVEHLDRLGVLSPRTLAVHCVQVGRQDLSKLQARGVTVVTCPRSNRRLGVGTAPVPRLLGAGIPVALGSDSLASAPDLDLFAEISALRQEHPGLAPAAILRMATLNGARALGLADELGSVERGKRGALVLVPLAEPGDDPLETATSSPPTVFPIDSAPWEAPSE